MKISKRLRQYPFCLLSTLLLVPLCFLLGGCSEIHKVAVLVPVLVQVDSHNANEIKGSFQRSVKMLMHEDLKRSQVTEEPQHLSGVQLLGEPISARVADRFSANRYYDLQDMFSRKPLADEKFTAVFMIIVEPAARDGFFQVESRLINLETGGVYSFMPGDEGLVVPLESLTSDTYWNFELRRLYNKLIGS